MELDFVTADNAEPPCVKVVFVDTGNTLCEVPITRGEVPKAENFAIAIINGLGGRRPSPDTYTWNKPGAARAAIEAFLREAEGYYNRHQSTLHDARGVDWLRKLLDRKPTEMGDARK